MRNHDVSRSREPNHEWAVILAGGDGTRLRDLSYRISGDRRPKQFCVFFGEKTLLAHTRDRLRPLFSADNTLFVLNRAHRIHYWRELSDVPSRQKLSQPFNRGTAPAILLAVGQILQRDPNATLALFPSDHHYVESSVFQATVDHALRLAKVFDDRILIIGAPATYPEVEYGWIQPGAHLIESRQNPLQFVLRFWEKPSSEKARALQQGGCLWNTFVTIGSVSAFLDLLAAAVPDLFETIVGKEFSESALERIYSEIESVDFSKDVLSALPEHLLVLRDGPSGWTDFGSPQRAMNVLRVLAGS